jgi:uncharacterized paraquat-inducible protein A
MPSCERCWRDAHADPFGDIMARYHELIADPTRRCTPEQRAGPEATECPKCERTAVHQYARICMACGLDLYVVARLEKARATELKEGQP